MFRKDVLNLCSPYTADLSFCIYLLGDEILEVNGESLQGLTHQEAIQRFKVTWMRAEEVHAPLHSLPSPILSLILLLCHELLCAGLVTNAGHLTVVLCCVCSNSRRAWWRWRCAHGCAAPASRPASPPPCWAAPAPPAPACLSLASRSPMAPPPAAKDLAPRTGSSWMWRSIKVRVHRNGLGEQISAS